MQQSKSYTQIIWRDTHSFHNFYVSYCVSNKTSKDTWVHLHFTPILDFRFWMQFGNSFGHTGRFLTFLCLVLVVATLHTLKLWSHSIYYDRKLKKIIGLLNWYSSMNGNKKCRNIQVIFDIRKWLWKSESSNFADLMTSTENFQ